MIIKHVPWIVTVCVLVLITGCGQKTTEPANKKKKITGFQTDQSRFIAKVDKVSPTRKQRNELIDEFIMKSNLQCQHYLNDPINRAAANPKKSELYMDIFDGVSEAFGVKNITDGAKRLYKKGDDPHKRNKAKLAYENALSPEIRRGVELARENYAQRMILRKTRLIESYTIPMLKRDMRNYDKLCNYETGLIEINKALKKAIKRAEKKRELEPFSPKINLKMIKNKVESVTKQAEANEASNVTIDVKVLDAKESDEEVSQEQSSKDTENSDNTEF